MYSSLFILLGAAAAVAILHSILPDHWIPLAVVARTQHWNLLRVGKVTLLASLGHVIASLILGGIIAIIGLQFQHAIETQQGHIIGAILALTGIIFLIWGLVDRRAHNHHHHHHTYGIDTESQHADHHHTHGTDTESQHADHHHTHGTDTEGQHADHHHHTHGTDTESQHTDHHHDHEGHSHEEQANQSSDSTPTLAKRLAGIAIPFGVAASPDLTILPIALAASAIGAGAVIGVLSVFAACTIITFIGLTIIATIAGYQIKGEWLEKHANTITSIVLIALGIITFINL